MIATTGDLGHAHNTGLTVSTNRLAGSLTLTPTLLLLPQGHTVSFKNCVIIMTSNLGSAQIFEHLPSDSREDLKARVMAEVRSHFRYGKGPMTGHTSLKLPSTTQFMQQRQLQSLMGDVCSCIA